MVCPKFSDVVMAADVSSTASTVAASRMARVNIVDGARLEELGVLETGKLMKAGRVQRYTCRQLTGVHGDWGCGAA